MPSIQVVCRWLLCGFAVLLGAGVACAQTTVTTSGGTTNSVPVFTGSSTLGNSTMSESGGAIVATGDIVPGGNGVLRAVVPIAMNGGEPYISGDTWQRITRTNYTSIPGLFQGTPVLPGATREYYLVIRRADNVATADNIGSAWRFACDSHWNGGTDLPGYGFTLPENWGSPDEGSTDWVAIPPTAVTQGCPSGTGYWKLDAEMPNGGVMRVMSVSMAAVDVYGGTTPAYSAAAGGNDTLPPLSMLYDAVWAIGNGYVGIGTSSPATNLEVVGNIELSGSGAHVIFPDGTVQSTAYTGVACGGDFAESVDVTGNPKTFTPGDVLVADPSHPGDFLKSSTPYSTAVLGVYSTKPGFVGRRMKGPKGPNEVPMAMVGIVPTKVTAMNGPIHVGDLLVTSSIPGYAMRGTDRSRMLGAIIGKALGNLQSGKGVIEVGVTLQ